MTSQRDTYHHFGLLLHDVDLLQDVAGLSSEENVRESQMNTSLSCGQRFRDNNIHSHYSWRISKETPPSGILHQLTLIKDDCTVKKRDIFLKKKGGTVDR